MDIEFKCSSCGIKVVSLDKYKGQKINMRTTVLTLCLGVFIMMNTNLIEGDEKVLEKNITITLSPVKDKFPFGGPVGVALTIKNNSADTIECAPFYSDHYLATDFSSDNEDVVNKEDEHPRGGESALVKIKAGDTYKALIYLNRYLTFKKAGVFDINCDSNIFVSKIDNDDEPISGTATSIKRSGAFRIALEEVTEEELEKELESVTQGLSNEENLKTWKARCQEPEAWEMTEALSFLDTPLCIKHLGKILLLDGNYARMALRALSRFKGEQVDKLIESMIDHEDTEIANTARNELKKRGKVLDEDSIRRK